MKPTAASRPPLPAAAPAAPAPAPDPELAAQRRFEEDQSLIQRWLEELDTRELERTRLQARHRDRLDDALDHLEGLRTSLRERAAEAEAEEAARAANTGLTPELEPLPEPEPIVEDAVVEPFSAEEMARYRKPELAWLRDVPPPAPAAEAAGELETRLRQLQDTLDSFSVDAHVFDATVGPRVTQFRVRPGFGVRVEAIAGLEKNIALAMSARAVRIQAPIPGESYVGVEIPNPSSAAIGLRGCLEGVDWRGTKAEIPIILGLDISGRVVICDLAKAPHALIAGATGSGKSVCIGNVLLSLLYRFRPDELELVLVDPKIVEFAVYRDLPHLIHPVVTDPKQACQALKWLVREMERRYTVLAERRVRNLAGYNAKAEAEGFDKLPFIVLIIDELADLMMTSANDVEGPIARLAQMSRAVGIHTILATQRPSVNVITGIIKANYPTRIAFQVSSQIDSRTILDSKGAESLQGRGDMLYNPPGLGRLQRLQAPFVDDAEIETVVAGLKSQLPPRYRVELRPEDAPGGAAGGDAGSGDEAGEGGEGMDPMLRQALEIFASNGRASTSFLQRKLKIGYTRAARIVEDLEARRYIGPQIGSNPREVYVQPGAMV